MEQVGNKPDAVDCTNWHGVLTSRTLRSPVLTRETAMTSRMSGRLPTSTGTLTGSSWSRMPRLHLALPLRSFSICWARISRVGEGRRSSQLVRWATVAQGPKACRFQESAGKWVIVGSRWGDAGTKMALPHAYCRARGPCSTQTPEVFPQHARPELRPAGATPENACRRVLK